MRTRASKNSGQAGFTLTEVMIAIMIFAIGILAASALQFNTLRVNKQAETIKELTQLATSELELKRQYHRSNVYDASAGQNCDSLSSGSSYTCTAAVTPCSFSGSAFSCSGTTTAATTDAHQVSVTVTDGGTNSVTLSTLVRTTGAN